MFIWIESHKYLIFYVQIVTPESLNRLVACTADDSRIIGICGETKVDNEEGSWWTMIQVCSQYSLTMKYLHYEGL